MNFKITSPQLQRLLIFLIIFLFFLITRSTAHFNLRTDYFDQYFFDNPLWNTIQGKPLYLSVQGHSFLANHFSPILFIFALPYFIHPSPFWIFAIQSLFIAGIVTLIFSFAQKKLDESGRRLILLLIFTNVTLRYMGFHDFHMDVVLTFLLTASMYLLLAGEGVIFPTLLMICGFLVKEVAGLVVASYGLFIFFFKKQRLCGLSLILAGILGTIFLVIKIIPQFSPQGSYFFSGYYSHFGKDIYQQVLTMLFNPLQTLSYVFTLPNIFYVFLLLAPFAFLPVFAPSLLVFGLFSLLQNLLSNYLFQKDITTQYSYIFVPILFYASILGIKNLQESKLWPRAKSWVKSTVIFFAILSILAFIILDLRLYFPSARAFSAHEIIQVIPKNASVSASTHLLVHLQYRDKLYLFPDMDNADYVIYEEVDRWLPEDGKNYEEALKELWNQKKYVLVLRYLFLGEVTTSPVTKKEYIEAIKELQTNKSYSLLKSENGVYLYQKKINKHGIL